jgi:hypothetical protein
MSNEEIPRLPGVDTEPPDPTTEARWKAAACVVDAMAESLATGTLDQKGLQAVSDRPRGPEFDHAGFLNTLHIPGARRSLAASLLLLMP